MSNESKKKVLFQPLLYKTLMKSFFIGLLITPSFIYCQLGSSDGSEAYYAQPDLQVSFRVYVTSINLENGTPDTFFHNIKEIKKYSNGLLKKHTEYYDKGIFVTYEYFYKGTSKVKCLVRDKRGKIIEAYHDKYDKHNNLIEAIGYDKVKVIYKHTTHRNGNEVLKRTYYNHNYTLAKQEERTITSNDGLEEFTILKLDQQRDPHYSRKSYDKYKREIYEMDSSKDYVFSKTHMYDSIGKLKQVRSKSSGVRYQNDYLYNSDYVYNSSETKIIETTIYPNKKTPDTTSSEMIYYDPSGNIKFSKRQKYGKPLGTVNGEKPIKLISEVVEKYYHEGRLQKVFISTGDRQKIYTIKYDQ